MVTINFFKWIKSRQKAELDLTKRAHMAQVIRHYNLIARQEAFCREFKSVLASPKVGS